MDVLPENVIARLDAIRQPVADGDVERFNRRCRILPLLDEKGRVAPTVDLSRCTVTYGSGVSELTL